ncbi:hypothetical protein BGZ99_009422 [Dissophora globulifera]|uniref:Uncharacterized protein n=1 Tax=Dissophora globulifera TaxID=979702 RepID=A0A9P6V0K5_9FUNG|nr:hypothetical protein BGZ99_009422 [Dissophora globulifera]
MHRFSTTPVSGLKKHDFRKQRPDKIYVANEDGMCSMNSSESEGSLDCGRPFRVLLHNDCGDDSSDEETLECIRDDDLRGGTSS